MALLTTILAPEAAITHIEPHGPLWVKLPNAETDV